jgi:glycosyltransferase involved in cell wall biosynthesis/SAM-dependent methyltransferase/predicted  nucleic acid-binding Zn-ribbon protein
MRLPEAYSFDAQLSVWRRPEVHAFAYTDGDAVEQRILGIVRQCADPSVFSQELAEAISDWPSHYHLGRGRSNLLRPFRSLLSGSVLEIGCGCGAITRALGESGAEVVALEGSIVRAEIAAARCRGLSNVVVVCDSFDSFEPAERFDVVTLIGVLEYARKYFATEEGQDPVAATLARARAMLKPGGVLLLAIENQLGLKYFAGRPEDHNGVPMYGIEDLYGSSDAVTFGEQELRGLLGAAGWEHQRWWYPFPDYKFPVSILSESGVRASADLTPLLQNSVLADPQRGGTSFSLESAWAPVFRNGLAGALANSFAVLASDRPLPQPQALAYHYASARRQSFAKEVAFLQDAAGEIVVEHRPLVPSAGAAAPAADGLNVEFERAAFVSGLHWQKELVRIVNRPGWSMAELQPWAVTWFQAFARHAGLADAHALDKDMRIAGDHFDAVPRNLIVRAPDDAVFIDQEWHLDEPCTLGYLVFRSLGLSFFGVTSVAQAAPQCSLALQDILFGLARAVGIPLSEEDLPAYVDLENAIQRRVGMQPSGALTAVLLAQWHLNVRVASWNPENVYRLEAEVARKDGELGHLGAEVHRLEAEVARKDGELGHLGAEVHRLETVVLAKDQRLQEVGQSLEGAHGVLLHKDHGLTHQTAEIARLEAALQDKQQRLQALDFEMNRLQVDHVQELDRLRHSAVQEAEALRESMKALPARVQALESEIAALLERTDAERHYFYAEVDKRDKLLAEGSALQNQLKAEWQSATTALQALRSTRWFRLREVLLTHPFGLRKLLLLAVTVGGGLLPRRWRAALVPRLQRLFGLVPVAPAKGNDSNAYQVKVPPAAPASAPKIVHAIANFMTGGSSRLVIDLVEYLGSQYRQSVLTSFNPDPPAYVGVDIEECRFPQDIGPLVAYFQRTRPDVVHVHYWGDCDEPWYAKVIEAAKHLGLPVIENINTPIAPHRSEAVVRYVYVSDYVRRVFGSPDAEHVTVYPGSDFGLFTRGPAEQAPSDCVGMVYRLERDKLNEDAIQPFIRMVQLRPQTRVLIVGGGSLYEPYREAVAAAGVADNFEFTGYVSYEQLPALYRRMSLFVAPVWKESFGQVSPFAMSMKVPVIGYDIGAIGEIVGAPSLLAPPADAEALARIAVDLLDAPENIHRLGEVQQRRAQDNFSIQAMIAHYARIYAEVSEQARKDFA